MPDSQRKPCVNIYITAAVNLSMNPGCPVVIPHERGLFENALTRVLIMTLSASISVGFRLIVPTRFQLPHGINNLYKLVVFFICLLYRG